MKKQAKSIIMRSIQVLINIIISIFVYYDKIGMNDKAALTGVKAFVFFAIPQITILEMFWERKKADLPSQRYFLGGWAVAFAIENLVYWLLPLKKIGLLIFIIVVSCAEIIWAMGLFKSRYYLPGCSLFEISFAILVSNKLFNRMVETMEVKEGMDLKTTMATKLFFAMLLPLVVTWLQYHNKSGIGVDVFFAFFAALLTAVAWSIFTMNLDRASITNYEYYFAVMLGVLSYLAYLSVAGKPTKLSNLFISHENEEEGGENN